MFRSLFLKLGGSYLGRWIRDAAEGKKGETLKALYWSLAGLKTWTGGVLALLTIALVAAGYPDAAAWITGTLAALLVSTGLIDKGWRSRPPTWDTLPVWQFGRQWWPEFALALGGWASQLVTCTPQLAATLERFRLSCGLALTLVTVLVAVGGWAFTEARLANVPKEISR